MRNLGQPMLNRLASLLEGIIENVKEKNSNTFLFILTASKLPHQGEEGFIYGIVLNVPNPRIQGEKRQLEPANYYLFR